MSLPLNYHFCRGIPEIHFHVELLYRRSTERNIAICFYGIVLDKTLSFHSLQTQWLFHFIGSYAPNRIISLVQSHGNEWLKPIHSNGMVVLKIEIESWVDISLWLSISMGNFLNGFFRLEIPGSLELISFSLKLNSALAFKPSHSALWEIPISFNIKPIAANRIEALRSDSA